MSSVSAPAPRTPAAGEPEIIYLIAPGGNPNYGDEFILRTWLQYLAQSRPGAQVIVDCHTPGQAAVLLSRWHPRVTFVDTVWRICFETADLPPREAAEVARDVLANPGRMPRIVSGVELLTRADTVHLVGGGYLNIVWSHHLALVAIAAAAARDFGVRAVATGQGLLPVGDDERITLVNELCSAFELFDVRDQPSRDALADGAVRMSFTGDDAWLGVHNADVYDTVSPAAQRDFVFCLQSDLMEDFADGQGIDGLAAVVNQVLDGWGVRPENVAFVEGLPGADRQVYDRVADRMPGALFVPFTEVWNRGLPARAGQVWISTRFHPHLLAAAAGASGVALSGRSDYYPIKHQSLIDMGSRWHLIDGCAMPTAPPADGGFPLDRIAEITRQKGDLAAGLYPPAGSSLRRAARAVRGLARRR